MRPTSPLPEMRIIDPAGQRTTSRTANLWAAVTVILVGLALLAVYTRQVANDTTSEDRIAAASRTAQNQENARLLTQLAAAETKLDEQDSAISQLSAQVRELQRTTGLPQRRIVIPPPAPRPTRTTAPRTIPIPPAVPTPVPEWTPVPSPSPGPSLELCTPLPSCVLPTPLVSVLPGPSAS